MLHFSKFQKTYGAITILNIDDLIIQPGIYWVKGANGSGKTTFLKVVAGILHFEGDIKLKTQQISIKKQPIVYRKSVNFAEAEPIFPEFLTGREMIDLFISAKGGSPGQENFYIDSMKMHDYIEVSINTYSSGMIKKLSIVLAFMGNPLIILFDEPLITLDTQSLHTLNSWIIEKNRKDRTSFLISSHQPLEISSNITVKEILIASQTVHLVS